VGKTAGGAYKASAGKAAAAAAEAAAVPESEPATGGSAKPLPVKVDEGDSANLAKALQKQSTVRPDADAYWFNNPQFQIRCDTRTTVHLSLMQQDRRLRSQLRENYNISFEVVKTKKIIADINSDHPRIWELEQEGVADLSHEVVSDSSRGP
jgi:hypothetical protein